MDNAVESDFLAEYYSIENKNKKHYNNIMWIFWNFIYFDFLVWNGLYSSFSL